MSPGDWIGFATVISTTAGVVAAAWWARRRPAEDDENAGQMISFSGADRELMEQLRRALGRISFADDDRRIIKDTHDVIGATRDVMLSVGRRLEQNTDSQTELRRAVQDDTAGRARLLSALEASASSANELRRSIDAHCAALSGRG